MNHLHYAERRAQLRQLFDSAICFSPAAIYDAPSALIAQDIGFEALILPGSTVSLALHAAPDMTLLTLPELAQQTYRIARVCPLPLIVDADHGYGNAFNVRCTVEDLENAGAAAIVLHDTAWPAAHGKPQTSSLIAIDEGVGKLRAALDARRDPSLVIVGRTDAAAISSFDDALARAKAYEDAGVDALFIFGVSSHDQVDALANTLRLPLILGGVRQGLEEQIEYLRARRVRIVTQGSVPVMAAMHAIHASLKALRAGTRPDDIENLASKELMQRVTRSADFARWSDRFLR